MNEELHKKIEETLASLDGMQRAEANPFLYSKIRNRMQAPAAFVPQNLAWRMVIALVVVALVNVFTIQHFSSAIPQTKNGAALVATEYAISLPQTY